MILNFNLIWWWFILLDCRLIYRKCLCYFVCYYAIMQKFNLACHHYLVIVLFIIYYIICYAIFLFAIKYFKSYMLTSLLWFLAWKIIIIACIVNFFEKNITSTLISIYHPINISLGNSHHVTIIQASSTACSRGSSKLI